MSTRLTNQTGLSDNDANQLTNHIYPDNTFVLSFYDCLGHVTNTVDSSGVSVTNYYDNRGQLDFETNIYGQQIVALLYDVRDRVTNRVDPNGVVTATTYDNLNRVLSRSYPDGGVEKFGYSAAGLIAHTNQLNYTNYYNYDAAMRKTSETSAIGAVTTYGYDAAGDLTLLTDPNTNSTHWNYDCFGRVTNKVDATTTVILKYQYDANSRLTNRWSLQKSNTVYAYDAAGNLTNVAYTVNSSMYPANVIGLVTSNFAFGYDTVNRMTSMSDLIGQTSLTYTAAGLLQSETGPWNADAVTFTYLDRLRHSLSLQQPNASPWNQSYSYDGFNRLTNVISPAGSFGYVYDAGVGGVSASSALVDRLNLPTGAYVANAFDANGRMTITALTNQSGAALDYFSYAYDLASERYNVLRGAGSNNIVQYTYDKSGEVIGDQAHDGTYDGLALRQNEQLGYAYDKAGNLLYRTNNMAATSPLVEHFRSTR